MGLNDFLDNPLLKALRAMAETLQAVLLVATTIGSIAVVGYIAARPHLMDQDIAVVVPIIAVTWIAALFCCWFYIRHLWNPTFYDILELRGELLIEAIECHHRYTYTKVQTVRAMRDVRLIEFRTHWTGHGTRDKFQIKAMYGHVLLDGQHIEEDYRAYRWVYARYPIARNRVERLGIQQVHEDDVVGQEPYYRDGGGQHRTRKLLVTTRFPLAEEPDEVEGGVWNSYRPTGKNRLVGQVPYVRHVNIAEGTVDYVVEVNRPKRHHSYGIKWRWPN